MAAADRGRGHDRPRLPAALDRRRAPGILLGAGRQRSDRGWFYFRHDEETARKAKVLTETRRRMGHPMLDVGRTDGAGRKVGSDQDAIARALELREGHEVEVWERTRFVRRLSDPLTMVACNPLKTWPMGRCALESGDAVRRSLLGI
jgi:hypothetical protein